MTISTRHGTETMATPSQVLLTQEQIRKGQRTVASLARDADDARALMEALGLLVSVDRPSG